MNRGKEGLHFGLIPFGYQFHPAIGKIADKARYLKPTGYFAHAESEADTLHPARIANIRLFPHGPAD